MENITLQTTCEMDGEISKIPKLKSIENWGIWKFQVRVILNSHGAWDVAIGSDVQPQAPGADATAEARAAHVKDAARWKKADSMVQKIIATSVGEQPMLHIINCTTGREMWQKLADVYEQKSESSIHMLQQRWYSATVEGNDDVATHIAKLEDLAHRLKLMGEQIPDSMIITKILMTLPVNYRYFVSAWESTPAAERTLVNLTSRLTIEESRNAAQDSSDSNALAARSLNKHTRNKFSKKPAAASGKCFACNEQGHWARHCPNRESADNGHDQKYKSGDSGVSRPSGSGKPKPQGQGLISEALSTNHGEALKSSDWVLDSGASDHMCNVKEWFTTYETLNEPKAVRIGNGTCVDVQGMGCINVKMFDEENWNQNHLVNVLYVPDLKYNLFSVGAALDKGLDMVSTRSVCKLVDGDRTVAVGVRRNKLYIMQFDATADTKPTAMVAHANVASAHTLQNWHERLAHQNYRHVKKVLGLFQIKASNAEEPFCDGCALGKIHRLPFPKSITKTEAIGEIIHADLCGPMQVNSIGGSRYFLLLKDDFSHFRTVYYLKSKTQVEHFVEDFLLKAEKHCPGGVRVLRTDNGLEFVNKSVKRLTHQLGIQHQRTVVYSPEQNGAAERENRTLMEAARTMLHGRGFDGKFWAEAVNLANYVLNASGNSCVTNVTPFEVWFQKKPNIADLKVFGEEVYTHIPKENRRKLDAKGKRGFFVGHEEGVKGYRVWYPDENAVRISRDIVFTGRSIMLSKDEGASDETDKEWWQWIDQEKDDAIDTTEPINNATEPIQADQQPDLDQSDEFDDAVEEIQDQIQEENIAEEGRELRDRRQLRRPTRYNDYVEIDDVLIAETQEPISFEQAMKTEDAQKWRQAMKEELEALAKNHVWDLVDASNGQAVIDNRWTFKLKRNVNGEIVRYKARLVARGFSQREGIDYTETFSPVVKFDSIRAMLAIAASEKLPLQQFDVKTAFLYGEIEENIFMRQPHGFGDGTGRVCKLNRSLYGLKQSSRCWNKCFTDFLSGFNLKATVGDPCVFTYQENDSRLILAIYIDDGLVMSSDKKLAAKLLQAMRERFDITCGDANLFLGLQIERGADGSIFLHQQMYAKRVLAKFNMNQANQVTIPVDPHQELSPLAHSENSVVSNAPYREAIGSLMYLSIATRPDITFAVNLASRYLEKPTKIHWNAVKRILKYLKGTVDYGIKFDCGQEPIINVYSDADYAGDLDTRRSTTGFVVKFGSSVISWSSQRQQAVALSTTEAEYMAASQAAKEIAWTKTLFKELLSVDGVPAKLFLDNQGAIHLIKNPVFHKRTKHIDVRYHHLKSQYEDKIFSLEYVTSKQQQADILTKPLPRLTFEYQRSALGVQNNDF